jgi:hypothetical protein
LITESYINHLFSSINDISRQNANFENLLIRNLLLELKIPCKIRQIGDVNVRINLFFMQNGYQGVAEIDLNPLSLLELPRTIIANIAILHSRFSIRKENILPLIFCNSFINRRSDFYEVLYDISNILNIQIHVISLFALFIS